MKVVYVCMFMFAVYIIHIFIEQMQKMYNGNINSYIYKHIQAILK